MNAERQEARRIHSELKNTELYQDVAPESMYGTEDGSGRLLLRVEYPDDDSVAERWALRLANKVRECAGYYENQPHVSCEVKNGLVTFGTWRVIVLVHDIAD
jgi:hypothetical protein